MLLSGLRTKKATALSLKSVSRPGLTQLGFVFLVLSKLSRCRFLAFNAGMGFPSLVDPVSRGLRDQIVGLRHLTDRAGLLNDHPTRPAA